MELLHRVIVHMDMDAFFAAVEQLDNPAYRGKPVIVGADPKGGKARGVVSTCSYEARVFGIHSAMPISKAWRLCPQGIYVIPRMKRYSELSHQIMEILGRFSPLVEQVSVDEAFLDCSGTEHLFGQPPELGMAIKQAVRHETGLTASVGIATNKSIAKIASDMQKPDGLTICNPGEEKQFLAQLPVKKLWGAGEKTVAVLEKYNLKRIGDIAAQTPAYMERILGKTGLHLWNLSQGIDSRPVEREEGIKSVSEEHTFDIDCTDTAIIERIIFRIADRIGRRIRSYGLSAHTVSVKIRLSDFTTVTRQTTLREPTTATTTIHDEAFALFTAYYHTGMAIRLIGVALSQFENPNPQTRSLFDEEPAKKDKLDSVLDTMRAKWGEKVTRGSFIKKDTHK